MMGEMLARGRKDERKGRTFCKSKGTVKEGQIEEMGISQLLACFLYRGGLLVH